MRPSLNILSDELIGQIVDEAKRVLAEVGMEIRGPEMRRRLLDHGLPLDAKGERVLFPRDVVEAAISSAPRSFVLYDRDGAPHADLGGDRVHFVPGSSGLKVLDHRDGVLDEQRHRGAGVRCLAALHDADELEEARRVWCLHRTWRAPDGRDDAALPG
jgi:trimethylamine--corrinoid protein Co-methyltransferase